MTLTPLSHKYDICVYLDGPLLPVTANFALFHGELSLPMGVFVTEGGGPAETKAGLPLATPWGAAWAQRAHHVCRLAEPQVLPANEGRHTSRPNLIPTRAAPTRVRIPGLNRPVTH